MQELTGWIFNLLNWHGPSSPTFSFPMDSLIICDSTDKISLYASEFIWLPLSVTSVESTEPGPEAAMHAAIMTLFTDASQVKRRALLLPSPSVFASVPGADERLASCGVSLFFCRINPPPMVNYGRFALTISRLFAVCLPYSMFSLFFHSSVFFFIHCHRFSWIPWTLLIAPLAGLSFPRQSVQVII